MAAPKDGAGRSAYRRKNTPGYALYSDRRWRGDDKGVGGLRWAVLVRDQFICRSRIRWVRPKHDDVAEFAARL